MNFKDDIFNFKFLWLRANALTAGGQQPTAEEILELQN